MNKNSSIKAAVALALTGGLVSIATAGNLNIPNDFSAGNTASAADVNANFDAVETEVDDNHARIQTLEGRIQPRARSTFPPAASPETARSSATPISVSAGIRATARHSM